MVAPQSNSLSDSVYETLKTEIVDRHLAPDSQLDIAELGERYGVSRMPILEAITRLKAEGLVISRNRVGTFVTPLDKVSLEQTYEARLMLEAWVTPQSILHLRNADVMGLRQLLQKSGALLVGVNNESFDYRQYIQYDHEFHLSLVRLCGNTRLIDFYQSLNSHLQIARAYSLRALERSQEGQAEHEAILDAFADRDVERARETQRYHAQRSFEGALILLNELGTL